MEIAVDGRVSLHVQDLGEGPAVVFLAGFGLDHRVWDAQVRLLSPSHRVVCVDQRGHGRSDAPLDGYDVSRLADDLLEVLDQLEINRCSLVGWSFGGQVAFQAASRKPEVVERVVLIGSNGVRASRSPTFPFGRPPEVMLPSLVAAEERDRLAARRSTIESGFATPPAPALLDFLVRCSLAMPSWAAVACYGSMLGTDLTDVLPSFRMPVHQIIGAADPVHSAKGARWLRERLPSGRLVELDGVGHYPMFENPAAFDSALSMLLTGAPQDSEV